MEMNDMRIAFISVSLMSALGIIFSVGLIILNFQNRNNRLVKMSSPMMNIAILIGAILLYVSNVVHGMTSVMSTWIFCRVWAWLLPVSFSLLYGCLFMKSWRVNRIFTKPHQTKTVIKDVQLISMTGVLILVDLIILAIWEALESSTMAKHGDYMNQELLTDNGQSTTPTTSEKNQDYQEPLSAHAQCTAPNYAVVFVPILLLYKGLYLMYGAYLAWAIRHVTIPPMDDSSCILMASHVTVISCCLTISVNWILGEHQAASYVCVATGVFFSTTVTVALEFVPKIHYWLKHQNDKFLKMTLAPCIQQSSSPPSSISPKTPENIKITPDESETKTSEISNEPASIPEPDSARPLQDVDVNPDTQDSGHDSPRSAIASPDCNITNLTMYQIENEAKIFAKHTPLHKSCSEGSASNFTPADIYDIALDSHLTRRRMYYDYLRRTRGLAARITETYDLDSDSDTLTYISHCLSPSQSMASLGPHVIAWNLDSDSFYPVRPHREAKRVKRKSRSQRNKMTSPPCHNLPRGSSASVV